MKRLSLILAIITVLCLVTSCGDTAGGNGEGGEAITPFEVIINSNEYLLYQNVFYNDMSADYVNKETTKIGTFAKVYDRYNEVDRYYVWGYYDQTKCCDWQWEFNPADISSLPKEGSKITVKGMFTATDKALDGYWIENPAVTFKNEYEGELFDVNMCLMSSTLERVQLANMQQKPEFFEGKTVSTYGRMYSLDMIQHPYYDGSWTQKIVPADDSSIPAIGTPVTVIGTYTAGNISNCTVEKTSQY